MTYDVYIHVHVYYVHIIVASADLIDSIHTFDDINDSSLNYN